MAVKKVEKQIPDLIGENTTRIDSFDKVTGSAVFTDDVQFGPRLLHGKIKRSPHPHAIIKKIDTSKAEKLPGVKAVVTGNDYPQYIGMYLKDRFIFARDRARFVGDPVAGVAATTEEIAEEALELIDVEYEVLKPVYDPLYGASPDAPLIHPDLGNYSVPNYIYPVAGTNIANHFKLRKGDVESAWKDCAAIVERQYYVPHIQPAPMETHIGVALAEENGNVTLWSSTQSPFEQRNQIAKALGIPRNKFRVVGNFVGGGFGCKAGVTMEALPVAIALKVKGHPVKVRLTREEEFYTNFLRQGLIIKVKAGCDKNGKLLALENSMYWDGGGYADYGVNITRAGGFSCTGPYNVPNVKADSYCIYTNRPIGGSYRGFGMAELHTGIVQIMDELAEKINMDKVEFLLLNGIQGGDVNQTGMVMHPVGTTEVIKSLAKGIEWGKKNPPSAPNKRRGKGIGFIWKAPTQPPNAGSSAWLRINEDGTVNLGIGGQELGQGTFTAMTQIAAGVLGVPVETVKISAPVDTEYSPYEWQTVASRLTWSLGNAVKAAAEDARQQVLQIVATAWQEDVDDLDLKDGYVVSQKSGKEIPLKDFAVTGIPKENFNGWTGGPVLGVGSFMPTYVTGMDKETGQGEHPLVHFTVGGEAMEIEIDLDTGQLEIIKAVNSFDVGKAINPALVRAQMIGGFAQGLSAAMFEEIKFKDGVVQNPSFVNYRVVNAIDMPREIETFIVEVPQEDGPWGARGVGEHPTVPTIGVLGNAIYDALGIRLYGPPYLPEKIFMAMVDAGIVK